MRLVFAGGGTGGHFLVGLSVAEEVKTQFPDSKILFFVTGKELETRCVAKGGFDALPLNVSPTMSCRHGVMNLLSTPRAVFGHFKGVLRSLKTIKQFDPDIVIGLGGYSSVPPLVAALLLGVPYVLLEQNVVPGKANRLMARWAEGVYCHWERSLEWFGKANVFEVTGTPIRKNILDMDREGAAKALKLSPSKKTLLVMGGSQGARSINEVIIRCLPELEKHSSELQIIHCTGESDYERVKASYGKRGINALVSGFLDNMGAAYALADLIICRAGATTIAEVTAIGIPAVFIPYPYASENHQYWNARAIAEKGGGIIIEEAELSHQRLLKVMSEFLEDNEKRSKMKNISKCLGKPDATAVIANLIFSMVQRIQGDRNLCCL